MKLNKLEYSGFRNLEKITIEPSDGVNIIYGENAQGKTNILEGIWLFSGLKSFRGAKDGELVKFGCDKARLRAEFTTSVRLNKAEILIDGGRKPTLNGIPLKSSAAMIGRFSAVVFSPSFLSVIGDGPSERRKFIDSAICQLKPAFTGVLTNYRRLLNQRSVILKDIRKNPSLYSMLDIIDEKTAAVGEELTAYRIDYINALSPYVTEIYEGLSSGKEEISLGYIQKGIRHGESLLELLHSKRNDDILYRITSVGPHRDDMDIKINGIPARTYGSRGQQRSCALALKLGEAAVIKSQTDEQPVMLLDDVMSELDESRQDYILNHIKDSQVFITCCDPANVLRLCEGKKIKVMNGKINE